MLSTKMYVLISIHYKSSRTEIKNRRTLFHSYFNNCSSLLITTKTLRAGLTGVDKLWHLGLVHTERAFCFSPFRLRPFCIIDFSMFLQIEQLALIMSNLHCPIFNFNAVVNANMCEEEVNVALDLWQLSQMLGNKRKNNRAHCWIYWRTN